MAVVGNALLNRFLGTSEAEKAFQPWWDTVEDFLVYGLVLLGKHEIKKKYFSTFIVLFYCPHLHELLSLDGFK